MQYGKGHILKIYVTSLFHSFLVDFMSVAWNILVWLL